jgi:hypothetical protein
LHLHELCDDSPESVELRHGAKSLAFETALERRGVVGGLSDEATWALIDRVISPDRRGPPVAIEFLSSAGEVGPYRLGSMLLYNFAHARIELEGDVDARSWKRVEIMVARAR